MVNELGHFPEVCKKSIQPMAADMQGPVPDEFFSRQGLVELRRMSSRELEHAGRLTTPLVLDEGSEHYRPVAWEQALDLISAEFTRLEPDQSFWYLSGRSSNEAAFLSQLFARQLGTNNVNNCSYYCHQASGVGLNDVFGTGSATISLADLESAEFIAVVGGNPASNHPRLLSTLNRIRRQGGTVVSVNPIRELGMNKFRVPSNARSMLLSSSIASFDVQPHIGGDVALLTAVAKRIVELGLHDEAYLRRHTSGHEAYLDSLQAAEWDSLCRAAGVEYQHINRLAIAYGQAERAVWAWTMGITHHLNGVENVTAIANLALLQGMVGRPGSGLLPIRGHSNVQGVGSMGVTPKLKEAIFDGLTTKYGMELPAGEGWDTMACMEAAHGGTA